MRGIRTGIPKTKLVLYTGLAGNLLVAATKAVAALITNSSSMWAEAVHSVVDSGDQILLLYGLYRSKLPPDDAHPQAWSSVFALREVRSAKGRMGFIEGFKKSKNPPAYMVLFEDVADVLGIVIAAIAVFGVTHFHLPALDGIAPSYGLILGDRAVRATA